MSSSCTFAGGYVVGRWKDDLDVEYVHVYRLETGR